MEPIGNGGKLAYPAEIFNLVNVIRDNRRLLSRVVAIKLGNVVDLNIILDTVTHADEESVKFYSLKFRAFSHAVTGRSVSVILAVDKIIGVVILQFLFKREIIEFAT